MGGKIAVIIAFSISNPVRPAKGEHWDDNHIRDGFLSGIGNRFRNRERSSPHFPGKIKFHFGVIENNGEGAGSFIDFFPVREDVRFAAYGIVMTCALCVLKKKQTLCGDRFVFRLPAKNLLSVLNKNRPVDHPMESDISSLSS